MTADLWGESATAPLHIVHLGYAAGAILGPLIAQPFLSTNHSRNASVELDALWGDADATAAAASESWQSMSDKIRQSTPVLHTIIVPFTLVAISGLLSTALFAVSACVGRVPTRSPTPATERAKPSLRELLHPGTCAAGDAVYGTLMLTLLVLLYVAMSGKEQPIFIFVYVLAVDERLHMSSREGALVTTMFYVAYTCGRLLTAVLGLCVPIQVPQRDYSVLQQQYLPTVMLLFKQ